MNFTDFKNSFDPLLNHRLASKQIVYTKLAQEGFVSDIIKHIKNIAVGGKRIRPYIAWSFYAESHQNAKIEDIAEVLIAIELLHIFCLVHDDIIDQSAVRHGVETTHEFALLQMKKQNRIGKLSHVADSQAVLVGDILFNSVYESLNNFDYGNPTLEKNIRTIFTQMIDEVCIGQMLDVDITSQKKVSDKDILIKNSLKTAYYSFVRPMCIGITLAGRLELEDLVTQVGTDVGIAFQMQDDLLDVLGDPKKIKKSLFSDVSSNQHTPLSQYIFEHGNSNHKVLLEKYTGKPVNKKDYPMLVDLFVDSGAIAYTNKEIATCLYRARNTIEHAEADSSYKKLLLMVVDLIEFRTS